MGGINSRVNVNPTDAEGYASVNFESGDVIYVGFNNKCVGTLTYNGSNFSGQITLTDDDEQITGQPLHFYFLGGVGFTPTVNNAGTEATVVISDQSSKYPVISYSASDQTYPADGNAYSAVLKNKVSIMKFNVTTPSNAAICITGMNNKVTVDFTNPTGTDNGFTYDQVDGGLITMPGVASSGASIWAIVLPQAALEAGGDGSAYTTDFRYIGTRPAIDEIAMNTFLNAGLDLSVGTDNPHFKDLSLLQEDIIAQDGDILSGIVNGNYQISIANGAEVTLMDATIAYADDNTNWPGIRCNGSATIHLSGTNTVRSGYSSGSAYWPGIYIPTGSSLTIDGSGRLDAFCGPSSGNYNTGGAGIGGGNMYDCGNIVINGGAINATGSSAGAGIGAGKHANCGTITINGGEVSATGGYQAAGIGCGGINSNSGDNYYSCGLITITGGIVQADGGQYGAGIGSGFAGGNYNKKIECNGINISGGTVRATGGEYAAGIGSGRAYGNQQMKSICGDIHITGGTVEATGGKSGAGIGSGNQNKMNSSICGAVTITEGVNSVTATMGTGAVHSIGRGSGNTSRSTCGTVTIGGTVYWDGSAYQNGGDTYLPTSPLVYPE